MRIDSRIPELPAAMLASMDQGTSGGQKVQNTSEPAGGSTTASRSDDSSNARQSVSVVSKPIEVKDAVEKLNKFVQSQKKHVNFSIDESTHSTVIKIFKTETGEMIKQYPPEEILAMAAHIRQSIGWIVDSKV